MIRRLRTRSIGPVPELDLEFGERLNVVTGDNGLGKSFLLDVIWWAMTRRWPREINPRLTHGWMARPGRKARGEIAFSLTTDAGTDTAHESVFDAGRQAWTGKPGRPHNPGLVLYAMADGGFAVWDSARNHWRRPIDPGLQERPPAYVFSPAEVWDGLSRGGAVLCEGLIRDWGGWQKENGRPFRMLADLLARLSPSANEQLSIGELTRISLDDVRDMPTIHPFRNGEAVPAVFASSAVRRVLAMSYLLIWSLEEHRRVGELLNQDTARHVTFLIDEMEAHLHPRWQRTILPAIIGAMSALMERSSIQLVVTTHSPLILASLEGFFEDGEDGRDAWFDLDAGGRGAVLTRRPFINQGDVGGWLTSPAFDLPTDRSPAREDLERRINDVVAQPDAAVDAIRKLDRDMSRRLSEVDPLWIRWRRFLRSRGLEA